LENARDLKLYQPKSKPKKTAKPKASEAQKYFQKKEKLEKRISRSPYKELANICYICLVSFPKQPEMIKTHLAGKKHQKKWKIYQTRKLRESQAIHKNL
jgi:hypothetical protein